jgi:hypothetical protein
MSEAEKLLNDKSEILWWLQNSFTEPKRIQDLSPAGQLLELKIIEEYVNFKNWALKQIEEL